MNKPPPASPRQRLQELLAVPDRQRTDAQWDEINELEIMLAPGNRQGAQDPGIRRDGSFPSGQPNNPGGGQYGKKRGKKFHKRPPRSNVP